MTSNCTKSYCMMCENYIIFSLTYWLFSFIKPSNCGIKTYDHMIHAKHRSFRKLKRELCQRDITYSLPFMKQIYKMIWGIQYSFYKYKTPARSALDKDDQFENKQPYITLKWDIFDVRFYSQLTLLSSWSHQRIPCLSFDPNLTLCILKICQETWMGICILCHSSTVKFTGYWFTHKKNKNITISQVQYHSCWWPGNVMGQDISSHDIDQDCWE